MVKFTFFGGGEVGFGAGHPEDVAVENHFFVGDGLSVVVHESFEGEGEEAVYAGIYKLVGGSCFLVEEVGKRSVAADVFAPDYGVAEQGDLVGLEAFDLALIEAVVFGEEVGDAVVGGGVEGFNFFPNCWNKKNKGGYDQSGYE